MRVSELPFVTVPCTSTFDKGEDGSCGWEVAVVDDELGQLAEALGGDGAVRVVCHHPANLEGSAVSFMCGCEGELLGIVVLLVAELLSSEAAQEADGKGGRRT